MGGLQRGAMLVSLQLACGMHSQWIPMAEAERRAERGECRKLRLPGKKCVGKAKPVFRLVPVAEPSESEPTPGPITFEEMEANVGCANNHQVRAARMKIRNYKRVNQHDPHFAAK